MESKEFESLNNWHIIVVELDNGKCYQIENPKYYKDNNPYRTESYNEVLCGFEIRPTKNDGSLLPYDTKSNLREIDIQRIKRIDYRVSKNENEKFENLISYSILAITFISIIIGMNFCS